MLWGYSSYCEDAAHPVRVQLILWGTAHTTSVCPISTSPILYSAGNGSVWPVSVALILTVRV